MIAGGFGAGARRVLACLGLALLSQPVGAEVLSETTYRNHPVQGTDAVTLVASMYGHALGRKGSDVTLAMIEPKVEVGFTPARDRSAGCRVGTTRTRMDFTITLPKAVQRRKFDPGTLSAWERFRDFVSQHELLHRRYLLECARAYDRKAQRVSAPTCDGVERELVRLFSGEMQACAARNNALDVRDAKRLDKLALFVAAERARPQLIAKARSRRRQHSAAAVLLRRSLTNR